MCKNFLINLKLPGVTLLLSLALLLLSLVAWPLPLHSVEKNQPDQIQILSDLPQQPEPQLDSSKPLIDRLVIVVQSWMDWFNLVKDWQMKQKNLLKKQAEDQQKVIDAKDAEIAGLKQENDLLKSQLSKKSTSETIGWTAAVVSVLGNVAQAIAYQIK